MELCEAAPIEVERQCDPRAPRRRRFAPVRHVPVEGWRSARADGILRRHPNGTIRATCSEGSGVINTPGDSTPKTEEWTDERLCEDDAHPDGVRARGRHGSCCGDLPTRSTPAADADRERRSGP